jgi:hypothetical protein
MTEERKQFIADGIPTLPDDLIEPVADNNLTEAQESRAEQAIRAATLMLKNRPRKEERRREILPREFAVEIRSGTKVWMEIR